MGVGENQSQMKALRIKVQHLGFKLTRSDVEWTEWEKKFIQSVNQQNVERLSSKQIEWINRLLRKAPKMRNGQTPKPRCLSNDEKMRDIRNKKERFYSKLWVGKNRKPMPTKPDLDEMG